MQTSKLTEGSQLSPALIQAQYDLRHTRTHERPCGLLILVNGTELSGKARSVTQLREWMDPRLLNVEATLGQMPAYQVPLWRRHINQLPRHGNVTVYFGNWYADVLLAALDEADGASALSAHLKQLSEFEADLRANHTHILKCWFHVDEAHLLERLKTTRAAPFLYHMNWHDPDTRKRFNVLSKQMLSQQNDWLHLDGSQTTVEASFAQAVLTAIQQALGQSNNQQSCNAFKRLQHMQDVWADVPDKLWQVDDTSIDKPEYERLLLQKQQLLAELIRKRYALDNPNHVVFVFEGMDAAGKGGAIKRLVGALDPREYQVYNIGAPTQSELEYPYLSRFWQRLPLPKTLAETTRLNRMTVFDRSWYGRVLVERVEGFAKPHEWQRAYDEINRLERDLNASGTLILKFWLAIDKQEQLERFEDRAQTPHKQHKLTAEDWRNRDRWEDYVQAASDMLVCTNTEQAPWAVIATNDKRTARLQVLDYAIKRLIACEQSHKQT